MSKLSNSEIAFTFDDFVLIPQHSNVRSRKDPDVSVSLPGLSLEIPIISSPMNTVTEEDMILAMRSMGAGAVLHRYMSIEDQIKKCERLQDTVATNNLEATYFVAIGATGDFVERALELTKVGVYNFCIDVANGHNQNCIDAIKTIKDKIPKAKIMAGNVSTYDGAYMLAQAGASSIRVGIGSGCFQADTRILMSNGTYKNIDKIQSGDMVINKDGNPVRVIKAWCTGIRKVIRLRHTQFYKPTYCTADHNYWVGNLNNLSKNTVSSRGYAKSLKANNIGWSEIGKIGRGTLTIPNNINFALPNDFSIELYKRNGGNGFSNIINKLDAILEPSYDSGYIFGTFLGDGWASVATYKNSERGSVHWAFGLHEKSIADKLVLAINNTIGKMATIKKKKNMLLVSLYYKPLANYLFDFGKKNNKYLPQQLLVKNNQYLNGLYDGLLDSDGHIEKNGRTTFTNTSPQLIELFGILEYMLHGKFPNYQFRGKHSGGLKGKIKNLNEAYLTRSLKVNRIVHGYQLIKILDATTEYLEIPVYDIEVDCPTHSFIANNAVVHNSMCTTRVVTAHGIPLLSSLEDCARIKWKSNGFSDDSPAQSEFHDVALIADGGIRNSGDIVKALAIGADAVIIGGLLAGTKETPGTFIEEDSRLYKYYAGMASEHGRGSWFDHGKISFIPEGVATKIPYEGKTVGKIIENLVGGLQSGMSYAGATNIRELQQKAQWMRITPAGQIEGTPHGKR